MDLNLNLGSDLEKYYLANKKSKNYFFNLDLTDLFKQFVYIVGIKDDIYKELYKDSIWYPLTFSNLDDKLVNVVNVFDDTYDLNLYHIFKVDVHYKENEPRIIRFRMKLK
jgi:hypothetical protein